MKLLPLDLEALKAQIRYSFEPINWEWRQLTEEEQKHVKGQGQMDRLRKWATS